jgi:hypothetical protein
MAKLDGGRELTRRRERWSAALRSLYYQLRTGRCGRDIFLTRTRCAWEHASLKSQAR